MLDLNDLDEPVTYINFNGEKFCVTKFCTVIIKLNLPLMECHNAHILSHSPTPSHLPMPSVNYCHFPMTTKDFS